MKLIKSDTHQCVLASFAMVMGTPIKTLIEELGHDGLERILDNIPEPACFRSFHPQEFVDLLLEVGYAAIMIELNPCLKHGNTFVDHSAMLGTDRFFLSLIRGDGVIFGTVEGRGHAVAWNREETKIYDPRGYTYNLNKDQDFNPKQFFLIKKLAE